MIKSTKLYFIDPGLAAFLVGIRSSNHILNHPLKGSLFENIVIAEIIKGSKNSGTFENYHFYRDSKGLEIDLLYQSGNIITPIEIKSSMTFSKLFADGIKKFRNISKTPVGKGIIFYNGEDNLNHSENAVVNPFNLSEIGLWSFINSVKDEKPDY